MSNVLNLTDISIRQLPPRPSPQHLPQPGGNNNINTQDGGLQQPYYANGHMATHPNDRNPGGGDGRGSGNRLSNLISRIEDSGDTYGVTGRYDDSYIGRDTYRGQDSQHYTAGRSGGDGGTPIDRDSWVNQLVCRLQSDDYMPMRDFEFWFRAIEKDDFEFVHKVLRECHTEDRHVLTNGKFQYDPEPSNNGSLEDAHLPCAFQHPLLLCMVFRSVGTMQVML